MASAEASAAVLVLGGMGFIVAAGAIALEVVNPGFFAATVVGLGGGEGRAGAYLFALQLAGFFGVSAGLLVITFRLLRSSRTVGKEPGSPPVPPPSDPDVPN